jgi:AAA ATPase domain
MGAGVEVAQPPGIALGDATNVAARLQQVAGSGEALLGDTTWRLMRSSVSALAVKGLSLKGKTDAVTAYRLIDVAEFPSRPASTTALVGRTLELSLLNDAFERGAANGRSQLISVIGAPGVGKSRLADGFLAGIGSRATVPHPANDER